MEVTDRSSGLINVIIVKAKKIFPHTILAWGGRGGENLLTEDIFSFKRFMGKLASLEDIFARNYRMGEGG